MTPVGYSSFLLLEQDLVDGRLRVRWCAHDGSTPIDVRGIPYSRETMQSIINKAAEQMASEAIAWASRPPWKALPEEVQHMLWAMPPGTMQCLLGCRIDAGVVQHAPGCPVQLLSKWKPK